MACVTSRRCPSDAGFVTQPDKHGIIKAGAGTWDVGNPIFTAGAPNFTLSAGTVIVSGDQGLGRTNLTLNGGTIQSSGSITFAPTAIAIGGDFTFTGTGNDVYGGAVSLGAGTKTIANSTTGTATRTFSGVIAGTGGGLAFTGAGGSGGSVLSNAANSYNGITSLSGGATLSITTLANGGSNSSLGAATSAATNLVLDDATLKYTGAGQSTDRLFSVGTGGATLDSSGSGAVNFTHTGAMGFNAQSGLRALTLTGSNTGSNTLAAAIADNGGATSLAKSGTGTWVLTGPNTFTGGTTVSSGTLQIGAGGTAGSVSGNIRDNATLVFNRSDSLAHSGAISGTGALVQSGTGTLTLSGNNAYSGGTTINSGTVSAGHTSAFGTGAISATGNTSILNLAGSTIANAVTVASGATVTGSGGFGTLAVSSGGIVSPGNSHGTLTAGDTTFAGGGSFKFEVNRATGVAGTNWDLLSLTGALTVTATSGNKFTIGLNTLDFTTGNAGVPSNFSPTGNYTFAFLTTTNGIIGFTPSAFALTTTGVDSSLTGAWSVAQSGNHLDLVYTASAIPEPSTHAALFGGVALVGALIHRRRTASRR